MQRTVEISKPKREELPLHPIVLAEIQKVKQELTPHFDAHWKEHRNEFAIIMAEVLRMLKAHVERIVEAGREHGIPLEAYPSSCGQPCDTCLDGELSTHYPYFRAEPNKEYFSGLVKTGKKGNVKKGCWKDMFRCIGLSEDEIERFYSLKEAWAEMANIYNKYTLRLHHLGLSNIGRRELVKEWKG